MEVGGAHGTKKAGQRRWRDGALVQTCFRTRRRQGIDDESRTRSSRATPEEALREGQAGAGLPVLFAVRQGVLGRDPASRLPASESKCRGGRCRRGSVRGYRGVRGGPVAGRASAGTAGRDL